MKTVNIKEVAQQAGVSIATVSNVLNRPEVVARPTRERVQSAIDSLGYVPSHLARQLGGSQQGTAVGLVLYDVRNPFLTDVARGAEDLLHSVGQSVVLCNTDVDPDREARYLDQMAQQKAQGVLITPADLSAEWLARQRARGLHLVLFHNSTDHPDVCSVAVDDTAGADMAVTHLLARGHDRIAFVTGPPGMRQSVDRGAGCHRAFERTGRSPDDLRVIATGAYTLDQGRRAGEQLLAATDRATAVFCANDLLALGVMQVALRAGLRVPDDLAIVGYDDIVAATTASVPLTTVHVDGYALGRTAGELIVDEMRNPEHSHRREVFAPRLVERFSA
ncbi:LacI family transcriptional regulator [Lipingzhangella halophila]|uniref:LacI family transcriptional regulator n=1 Tax=Lipingzhangella halophila TaxID=1783352 RepID=A0A7W7W5M2_9ACTN|nr:LacI family DNA-binding transcriptional regulator [Lipingzhangella halophila]MBB4934858.1 LacI family transcriptional regulator [Lipingzhangella halophila]